MDIPRDELAIFSRDGRVFYDLDALLSGYEEHLGELRLAATTAEQNERANGVAYLIATIRDDLNYLRAENAGTAPLR
jgi:hypothetical protein